MPRRWLPPAALGPLLVLALLSAGGASAAHLVRVEPSDGPLVFPETSAGAGGDRTRSLRVTAVANVTLAFRPWDLTTPNGTLLDRSHVTVPQEVALAPPLPMDFPIVVSGITVPGNYSGHVEVIARNGSTHETIRVNLSVLARPTPTLTPFSTIYVQHVECWGRGCWLAEGLLPGMTGGTREVRFTNPLDVEVVIVDAEAVLANLTGSPVPSDAVRVASHASVVPPRGHPIVNLTLDHKPLKPGHYTGALHLTLADGGYVEAPVTMDVRSGPVAPLLALLLGGVLSFFARWVRDKGKPQLERLADVERLEASSNTLRDVDWALVEPAIKALKTDVLALRLAGVKERVETIETRIGLLARVERVEDALPTMPDAERPPLASQIKEIRDLAQGQFWTEVATRTEALEKAHMARVGQAAAGAPVPLSRQQERPTGREDSTAPAEAREVRSWWKSIRDCRDRLRQLGARLRPYATRAFKVAVYLGTILLLAYVGLKQLYVEQGATFGTSPIQDHVGLFLWGFTAEMTTGTIGSAIRR